MSLQRCAISGLFSKAELPGLFSPQFVLFIPSQSVQYVITAILAHRMLAVHCNGLNSRSSLRSLLRDIFPVYFYILGLTISYKVYFCHTDCYLGNQNCNGM